MAEHGTSTKYTNEACRCAECREAQRVTARAWRARNGYASSRLSSKASSRALWRLVESHREEYEHFRAEEALALRSQMAGPAEV
jgi:muconolactone delta-isomerase